MSLFQKAPTTQEEVDAAKPLDIAPSEVLEMTEEEWYAKVYRGNDVPQLTIRAVLMGSFLGFLLAFTNLYIGLKTGWGLGVAITACILSYTIWNVFLRVGLAKTPMTILETNCMQSTASSAGYATGGTMVSAIAAMLMLSATESNPLGVHIPWPALVLWTVFLGALGTVMAIPMKRNMINQERLKFPSGTAAAVTLQSLYSEGASAVKKARAMIFSAGLAATVPIFLELEKFRDKIFAIPTASNIFNVLPARGTHIVDGQTVANKPSDWTLALDHNPVMIAAGAIVGLRIAIYMVLGGLLLAYGVGPEAYEAIWERTTDGETIRAASEPYAAWKEIGIWLGVPIMVASGLLSFAFQWKTIVRAVSGMLNKTSSENKLVSETEVPTAWFMWGTAIAGAGVIGVSQYWFGIPWYFGVIAVALTFVLSLVACRATGESDITPVGAMGKIMQLTYGVLIPQSTTANLMTASITASSAGSAADLLNDLKSGYLLGANPRRQFIAQFMGIFTGTIATVAGFYLLVPDATALLGTADEVAKYPAPAAQAWKAVAEVFKFGLDNMHPMHQSAIYWGLGLGTIMVVLEKVMPRARAFLPSATGIGLGLILPFQYPLAMLIGAVIAAIWTKRNKQQCDDYLIPIASGVIAGVSIMGVIVAILNTLL